MSEHLDLDGLADVLAGEPAPAHLGTCAACTAALDELRAADSQVRTALRELPEPTLPDGLADRLDAALAREADGAGASTASVTTLPAARPASRARWLPAAAAAVLLLGGAAFGVAQLTGSDSGSDSTAGSAAAPAPTTVRNSTGTDYTGRSDLAAAVPRLLAGTAANGTTALGAPAPQRAAGTKASAEAGSGSAADSSVGGPAAAMAADPLAALRSDAGLADCLAALLPPEDPSVRPLALDYGAFRGQPALVVLLPTRNASKLDVFVVGAGCSRADGSVLFYASVPAS